jgi:hypothetical protein
LKTRINKPKITPGSKTEKADHNKVVSYSLLLHDPRYGASKKKATKLRTLLSRTHTPPF